MGLKSCKTQSINDIGKLKGRTESGKFLRRRGPSYISRPNPWKDISSSSLGDFAPPCHRRHHRCASIMASRSLLQVALLLCLCTTSLSMSYNLVRCQELLKQLNGKPEYCLSDRMDFKFPEEFRQPQQFQKEDAAFVIHEMLQNICDIFRKNFSNAKWNDTIIEDLFIELDQQMSILKKILWEKLEEQPTVQQNIAITLHLKRYYWRIQKYLKVKRYSSCAWTVVQGELLRNFSFINRLTSYLQN
ncbi:interferon beta [Ctenodactylus gundi]